MNKEFLEALDELEREKNIPKEEIISAIETAVKTAYEKNFGGNTMVEVDRETGEVQVFLIKDVVAEVEDDENQVSLEEARQYDPDYEEGDEMYFAIDPKDFGRIAAQTAKQIVVQKVREAERQSTYSRLKDKQGTLVSGRIERINNGTIFLAIDNTEGILPVSEQVHSEHFKVGDRIKVFVMDVKDPNRPKASRNGPQVFFSRSHPGLVRELFKLEIPEIADGTVEIKGIAREAGSRTKIAVYSHDPDVDPVGACVGNRGARVQAIVDELNGEKIDIIVWDEEPAVLISNVLRPAVVESVYVEEDEQEKMAIAVVPDQQLSLAIGREGQNVRLAARVSGWKIDIKSRQQLEESGFKFDEYEDIDQSETTAADDIQETQETEEVQVPSDSEEGETVAE
ncbi:transcription termination factor NusA [Baileyella intestinalis]|jgi:N utilization substance protein A|uniref:Transcription termination/antitermination protein NusA n=1 Tax=Baileyella intestinalis TaxID=2606709 RepID=A0A6A8M5R5_9FIRM|nr:transcription termination factor NusA [Baileyella intestinalis]MCI7686545.1 transcription termination factor NusA [Clostridiales bacterium]MDY2995343.1 transcription termination factor NusA [Baileyella intestinalis]MST68281.1 transcription termination/antitermination protein NusA [Baileyella intestinalis]